jgi:hypothetical protein
MEAEVKDDSDSKVEMAVAFAIETRAAARTASF